jgi:DNA-binding transcriptional MerR regulator|tara:strand:- start:380 stop:754 length:375 start_codon:yes stop_codon:yes gene_type:complete
MLKNKNQLLNISQAATKLGLINKKSKKPLTQTLRFWETKFKQLRPTILSGSRRYYSLRNIDVIKMIIFLLKDKGLTINGAVKIMNNNMKNLDRTKVSSIKAEYIRDKLKVKSKKILERIKKLNG